MTVAQPSEVQVRISDTNTIPVVLCCGESSTRLQKEKHAGKYINTIDDLRISASCSYWGVGATESPGLIGGKVLHGSHYQLSDCLWSKQWFQVYRIDGECMQKAKHINIRS